MSFGDPATSTVTAEMHTVCTVAGYITAKRD